MLGKVRTLLEWASELLSIECFNNFRFHLCYEKTIKGCLSCIEYYARDYSTYRESIKELFKGQTGKTGFVDENPQKPPKKKLPSRN